MARNGSPPPISSRPWNAEMARAAWPISQLEGLQPKRDRIAAVDARLAEIEAPAEPPASTSPSSTGSGFGPGFAFRNLDREEREEREAIIQAQLAQASPSEFARVYGTPPTTRPPARAPARANIPDVVERALQERLASKAATLPPPVAEVATRPPTMRSPVPASARPPATASTRPPAPASGRAPSRAGAGAGETVPYQQAVAACSGDVVRAAIAKREGNKAAAARDLGLTREGLYDILRRTGWKAPSEAREMRARAGMIGVAQRWPGGKAT